MTTAETMVRQGHSQCLVLGKEGGFFGMTELSAQRGHHGNSSDPYWTRHVLEPSNDGLRWGSVCRCSQGWSWVMWVKREMGA